MMNCTAFVQHGVLLRAFCGVMAIILFNAGSAAQRANAAELLAGVAKADITNRDAGPVNDPLYAKALVLKQGSTVAVLVTVDAVSIGGIGYIPDSFLPNVRRAIEGDLGIPGSSILVNASHCHGIVSPDVEALTILAIKDAWSQLQPVRSGAGAGREDRIMENRRLKLKDGRETDVRHAYSMPADEDVAEIGPVDPEVGLLRLDRLDGRPLAVVYNFACHPIQGVAGRGNSADFPAYASQAIEETLGEGVMAFFIQGCAGDINPVLYKDVHQPRDCQASGSFLGLSVLRGLRSIETAEASTLRIERDVLQLPRAADYQSRIARMEEQREQLLNSLAGTSLNLKTFMPLYVQYQLSEQFPGYYSHRYLKEAADGRGDLIRMDADNRANLQAYIRNIQTMEELTRLQTNLALLRRHQQETIAAGESPLEAELCGLRVGDFRLVTFPGELTVRIGLNLKQATPHPLSFVAGYTNGYLFYTPTAEQRLNPGYAQEDCDCLVAPEWQALFESRALEMLGRL